MHRKCLTPLSSKETTNSEGDTSLTANHISEPFWKCIAIHFLHYWAPRAVSIWYSVPYQLWNCAWFHSNLWSGCLYNITPGSKGLNSEFGVLITTMLGAMKPNTTSGNFFSSGSSRCSILKRASWCLCLKTHYCNLNNQSKKPQTCIRNL